MSLPPVKNTVEVRAIFGALEAFPDDLITNQIVAFGAHTRPELGFLLSVVDPGDDVFDLGAHIGSFAIPLAQRIAPAGRILAVEALPETFAVLERNLRRSALLPRATPLHALIAPAGSRYAAQIRDENTGASFFLPTLGDEHVAVATTTLDALCHACFVPRVVKIDLEGFEVFALSGAQGLLATRPIIYAEVAEVLLQRCGSAVDQLDAMLASHGYRYFRNVGERNAAHDEFVVAELPTLAAGGEFFDVLAVHRDDARIGRLLAGT